MHDVGILHVVRESKGDEAQQLMRHSPLCSQIFTLLLCCCNAATGTVKQVGCMQPWRAPDHMTHHVLQMSEVFVSPKMEVTDSMFPDAAACVGADTDLQVAKALHCDAINCR